MTEHLSVNTINLSVCVWVGFIALIWDRQLMRSIMDISGPEYGKK